MYNFNSNSIYLYKSILTILFVFIQECTYNYKRRIRVYTSVNVQINVFESYKCLFILM